MTELNKKPTPRGKPVKSKNPLPAKEESVKMHVPCSLTEERVREIAKEEIIKWEKEKFIPLSID